MIPLGVVQRYDFAGLDLTVRNLANPGYEDAPADGAPRVLLDLVRERHYGVKTGKGFYDHGDRPLESVLQARDEALLDILEKVAPYLRSSLAAADDSGHLRWACRPACERRSAPTLTLPQGMVAYTATLRGNCHQDYQVPFGNS